MSENVENMVANPGMSSYDKASWYVFFAPVAALAVGIAIFSTADHFFAHSQTASITLGKIAMACEGVAQLVIFVFSITVCCKLRQHRRRLTIWLAGLGLLASLAFGTLTLLVLSLTSVGPC